ncbi:hypothetical protein JX265_005766 [Neoarthrinium moseri]|uniref:Uncharacterized protein n=1 Tax=Neoarthrinium moseri TaxID=1658444 RepID=A0A9P9WN45_9PEZI|nr:uncharacterized protein JN550_012294 [Neoarthrinium moseri]KAI1841291.1 hypothetical protein JX266_012527 [Neoarthrinium moseri]KAI1858936.1 hypothetical protein JN550_012294 [Neoarthrinium moseri]KAI1871780.1 hypothetical protein JX265_005766 [Neoarthrinium moseri]
MMFITFLASASVLFQYPVSATRNPGNTQILRRQVEQGTLFGPVTLPTTPLISNISVSLINFNDEVFDISSISVFGDINDMGCEEAEDNAPESHSGQNVVLGPADAPWSSALIRDVEISLINFNDEVFDISSISIFGDVNDGDCQPSTTAR